MYPKRDTNLFIFFSIFWPSFGAAVFCFKVFLERIGYNIDVIPAGQCLHVNVFLQKIPRIFLIFYNSRAIIGVDEKKLDPIIPSTIVNPQIVLGLRKTFITKDDKEPRGRPSPGFARYLDFL